VNHATPRGKLSDENIYIYIYRPGHNNIILWVHIMYRGVDCCSPVADLTCRLDTCRAHTNQSMVTISRARCYIIIIIIIISVLYYCYYHYTRCIAESQHIYIYFNARDEDLKNGLFKWVLFLSPSIAANARTINTVSLSLVHTLIACLSPRDGSHEITHCHCVRGQGIVRIYI